MSVASKGARTDCRMSISSAPYPTDSTSITFATTTIGSAVEVSNASIAAA